MLRSSALPSAQLADHLREEGKIEGKQEGLAKGRLRALQEPVLRALEIRHGRYPEGIRAAVENIADPAVLDGLLESAFRSNSLEDFAQKLEERHRHPSTGGPQKNPK